MAERGSEFHYTSIELLKSQHLGSGSYGAVCKANCDGLLCAAKIVHPTLFDLSDPGASSYIANFIKECRLLSLVRHPHIVQYLAVCYDPDTRLPVLLMELCNENLSVFLERSPGTLSYHIQVSIAHDIALALVYLHSNGLIHRDLTGNNVLVVDGPRAKITDFGMSKLVSANRHMSTLTQCPGNMLYMAPEALDDTKCYTTKLDIFSVGVIIVQIITREFPDPAKRLLRVFLPQFNEPLMKVVPETERRWNHLRLISDSHPLKPVALPCLGQKERQRPSALELSERLSVLKQTSQSGVCIAERKNDVQQLREERILTETKAKKTQLYQASKGQLQTTVDTVQKEIEAKAMISQNPYKEKGNSAIVGQNEAAESAERELPRGQLKDSESLVCDLQEQLEQRDATISYLQRTASVEKEREILQQQRKHSRSEVDAPKAAIKTSTEKEYKWREGEKAPEKLCRGSAVVHGDKAYFRPASSQKVYSYRHPLGRWSLLSENPHESFSLAVVHGSLTSVGGWDRTFTGSLLSLIEEEGEEGRRGEGGRWVKPYPPMPTPRRSTTCFTTDKSLVTVGGYGVGGDLDSVELMNTEIKQWSKCCPLPQKCSQLSGTLHANVLYLTGGYHLDSPSRSVLASSVRDLETSNSLGSKLRRSVSRRRSGWKEIRSLPVAHSTLVSFRGELLSIGGEIKPQTPTNSIYRYDSLGDSWAIVGQAGDTERSWCFAVSLSGDELLMVVGGCSKDSIVIDNIDICQPQ